jgi:hypothetical protein
VKNCPKKVPARRKKYEQGIFRQTPPENSCGFNQRDGAEPPNQPVTQQQRDVDGVMKQHDITGWLKNRRGGTFTNTRAGGGYYEDPTTQGDVKGVMKIHDITGWIKLWGEGILLIVLGMGMSSHEKGLMKLHDLTGWLKLAMPNNKKEEGVRWNLLCWMNWLWFTHSVWLSVKVAMF